jgi:hypothetical protein
MLRLLVQDGEVVQNGHAFPFETPADLNEVKGLLRVCQTIVCYPEERYLIERSQASPLFW